MAGRRVSEDVILAEEAKLNGRVDGLTDAEGAVSDALLDAIAAFGQLPNQHPQEAAEFVDAIHRIQGLLTTRIARRHYPEGWPTH